MLCNRTFNHEYLYIIRLYGISYFCCSVLDLGVPVLVRYFPFVSVSDVDKEHW